MCRSHCSMSEIKEQKKNEFWTFHFSLQNYSLKRKHAVTTSARAQAGVNRKTMIGRFICRKMKN